MIDWHRIAELREEIGPEDFSEVVALFLEEVEAEIDRLRSEAERDGLESRLHFLKGSALNLGFEAFSKLCQEGESSAARGQSDTVDLSAILASYDASKTEFLAALSG